MVWKDFFIFFFLNEHPWLFFFLSFFFFPSQILTCFLSPLMSFGSSFSFVAAAIKMHYSTVSCVLCFSALLILNLIKASAPISIAVVLCGYGYNQCWSQGSWGSCSTGQIEEMRQRCLGYPLSLPGASIPLTLEAVVPPAPIFITPASALLLP